MDNFIPFSRPTIGNEEVNSVVEVLTSGWLTVGKKCKEFESNLANYTGCENVLVTDSCTSALTVAARAIKDAKFSGEPSTALIPALTFVATANALKNAGYYIDFCDVGFDGNIDVDSVDKSKFDIVVPVHFAGQVCDLEYISSASEWTVLEDAAHAIGAKDSNGNHVGNSEFTDGACFSFYPTKNMTTVEGGSFISKNKNLVDAARSLSLHGLDSSHINRYERSSLAKPMVSKVGYKANMTDVEASIGIEQLKKLDYFILIRKRISKIYTDELGSRVKMLDLNGRDHVWHMFVILVPDRDNFVQKMKDRGIGVGIHYSPVIPEHPYYKNATGYKKGKFPVAEYISEHCLSLPLFPSIKDDEIERIISAVKDLT